MEISYRYLRSLYHRCAIDLSRNSVILMENNFKVCIVILMNRKHHETHIGKMFLWLKLKIHLIIINQIHETLTEKNINIFLFSNLTVQFVLILEYDCVCASIAFPSFNTSNKLAHKSGRTKISETFFNLMRSN